MARRYAQEKERRGEESACAHRLLYQARHSSHYTVEKGARLGRISEDELGPKGLQQNAPLHGHGGWHRQHQLVPFAGSHKRQANAGVPARCLNKRRDACALPPRCAVTCITCAACLAFAVRHSEVPKIALQLLKQHSYDCKRCRAKPRPHWVGAKCTRVRVSKTGVERRGADIGHTAAPPQYLQSFSNKLYFRRGS